MVQEPWDLILSEDTETSPSSPTTTEPQVFLAISQNALLGISVPRTVQFSGSIQGIPLRMLLDSGSSSSFISASIAAKLQNVSVWDNPCNVCIAGGGILPSSATLLNVQWTIAQYDSVSDLRVLPLAVL